MTAQYWVLASDELMTSMDPSLLPDGLRISPVPAERSPSDPPGMRWYLAEDDSAPAELNGCKVELILARRGREGAKSVIAERRVLPLWMIAAATWASCCTACWAWPAARSRCWPCWAA